MLNVAAVKLTPAKLAPLLIAGAVTAIACLLQVLERKYPAFDAIRQLEWITYDWRVQAALKRPAPTAENLGAVFIDDQSIELMNRQEPPVRFPWPRDLYAALVDELGRQGAKAVGFDILFIERDAKRSPDDPATAPDEMFARSMAQASNVVLAAEAGNLPNPLFRTNALALGDIGADYDSDGALRRVKPFRVYRFWHPILERAALEYGFDLLGAEIEPNRLVLRQTGSGDVTSIPLDAEGRFNIIELTGVAPRNGESPLARPFEERRVWHLGVMLAALALDIDLSKTEIHKDRMVLHGPSGLSRTVPLDEGGYFHIDWHMTPNDPALTRISFTQVWDAASERAKGNAMVLPWKDKLFVVGSIATGNNITDLGKTPLGRNTYLIGKHWNVANSIITGRFVQRIAPAAELLIIIVLGVASGLVTWRLRAPWPTIWVLAGAAVYVLAAFALYIQWRYWLPIVLPVVGAMFLNHLSVETYRVVFEQKEKRRVKSVFSKLVSPNVVDEMLKSEKLNLGGSRLRITVFFADVRGFTSMTDEYAAKADEYVRTHHFEGEQAEAYYNQQARITLETVNMYLSTIADTVKKHQGTLDKYMGDCVMAFWGAPTPNPRHALSCVRAAIEAQRNMYALNQRRAEENKRIEEENLERIKRGEEKLPLNTLLSLGTGINTGYAIVGLMGSERHILNYTVFGREVNVASRLEGVSGRGRIIIGEATYQDILRDDPELAAKCVELEPVMVKGIKKPVRIYEVPWKEEEHKAPEASPESGSTGFFRLEKETIHIPKPPAPAEAQPAKQAEKAP